MSEVDAAFAQPERWSEVCGEARPPAQTDVLIFLGSSVSDANEAAAAAGAAGYARALTLQPLEPGEEGQDPHLDPRPHPAHFTFISPNALATLLGYGSAALPPLTGGVCVIDVRRQDERLLYGSIHGSHALPGRQSCGGPRILTLCENPRLHAMLFAPLDTITPNDD